ncbi:MAG: adenosylmethionine--8-amino-7-oxononanoate transaminase [Deltaproteobacteria bacterium]|nr:adenosylmethionine--8-amino-7-oxononanoate transaminase [Deltaproteobacteria bacterium]
MTTRDEIVALDKQLLWHPYTPMRRYIDEVDPLVVARAEGIHVWDEDGQRYLDGNSSWWVSVLGHNHPHLMDALRRQTETLAHCSMAGTIHEGAVRLAERVLPKCGDSFTRLFYSDDGSTAVEVALRMAYQHWSLVGRPEKQRFATLEGAFHGDTVGAASVSGADVYHDALGSMMFERTVLPSPAGGWEDALAKAGETLHREADRIAAVIVEPLVQGAAGMQMYPPDYLTGLRALCDELDILLITDEVFVGYGRTGTFLAQHQASIQADIVCLAKGFSGGVLPMAATVTNDRVFEPFLGGPENTLWYGHSFTGNPLGCAVALATLDVFEEQQIIENLPPKCEALARGLASVEDHPWVRDVRRTGLIGAFTLVEPGATEGAANYMATAGWRFYDEARKRGAVLRPMGNVAYFVLPLIITAKQIDELFGVVRESLDAGFPRG